MSKPSGNQTVTQAVDQPTQQYRDAVWDKAKQVANQGYTGYQGGQIAGANPGMLKSLQQSGMLPDQLQQYQSQASGMQLQNQQAAQQAGVGMGALSGNQRDINTLMNPFQQNVVDQIKGQYGDLNNAAQTGIQQQATQAGAYGGSRHGVASGIASAEIAKGLGQQIAGVEQQGYDQTMNRAGQLAGLGQNAQQMAQQNLGYQSGLTGQQAALQGQNFAQNDYLRQIQQQQLDRNVGDFREQRDWGLRGLGAMQGAMGAPYGQTTSQPMYSNPGAGFLGGAATGAGIGAVGGPIGAGIGAGVGGILGLF